MGNNDSRSLLSTNGWPSSYKRWAVDLGCGMEQPVLEIVTFHMDDSMPGPRNGATRPRDSNFPYARPNAWCLRTGAHQFKFEKCCSRAVVSSRFAHLSATCRCCLVRLICAPIRHRLLFYTQCRHRLISGQAMRRSASSPTPNASVAPFVSTARGASPGSMQVGMIPDEPAAFIQMMSKPIMRMELATPPTRRRARNKGVVSMTPRRSIRLDKKVAHRMPTVITTQNLLMRKLGLISSSELKPDYLEHYAKIFAEGLTEEKVRMIDELFMDYVPATEAAEVLVDEEV
jgi:hypothetical protein